MVEVGYWDACEWYLKQPEIIRDIFAYCYVSDIRLIEYIKLLLDMHRVRASPYHNCKGLVVLNALKVLDPVAPNKNSWLIRVDIWSKVVFGSEMIFKECNTTRYVRLFYPHTVLYWNAFKAFERVSQRR